MVQLKEVPNDIDYVWVHYYKQIKPNNDFSKRNRIHIKQKVPVKGNKLV